MFYQVNPLLPSPSPAGTTCLCPHHKYTTELHCHHTSFPSSFLFFPPSFDLFILTQPRVNRTLLFACHCCGESAIPACTSHQGMHFNRRLQILSVNATNYSRSFYVKCASCFIHYCALLRRKEEKR